MLSEDGVRSAQVFQGGWDQQSNLPKNIEDYSAYTDRANAALIIDLEQRGMLEDTLVVWGGEFGRTVFCQGKLTRDNVGREHHPMAFTVWLAGGDADRDCSNGGTRVASGEGGGIADPRE